MKFFAQIVLILLIAVFLLLRFRVRLLDADFFHDLRRGFRVRLLGPVFFYDLLRTSRRGRYIVFRGLYAAALLILIYLEYDKWFRSHGAPAWKFFDVPTATSISEMARFATSLFYSFMSVQFAVVFLMTPVYAASAITEEKERRTLDFILTTDLYDREIILNKLASRVATMLLLLLAGLPILGFLQLLGGIDPNLLLAGFAATALTVTSVASLSILVAVHSKRTLNAIAGTYCLVALYLAPSFCMPFANWGNIFTARYRLDGGRDTVLFSSGGDLGIVLAEYVAFHVLVTVVCIVWATRQLRPMNMVRDTLLPRRAPDTWASWGPGKPLPKIDISREREEIGGPASRLEKVLPPVGDRAMHWKEYYFEDDPVAAGSVGMFYVFCGCLFLMFLLLALSDKMDHEEKGAIFRSGSTALAALLCLVVAVDAASRISRERDQQTLDSLFLTTIDRDEILRAKFLGCLWRARHFWFMLGPLAFLGSVSKGLHWFALPIVVFAWLILMYFSTCLGLWFSLICRTTMRATIATLVTLVSISFIPLAYSSLPELSPLGMLWELFMDKNPMILPGNSKFALVVLAGYCLATFLIWTRSLVLLEKEAKGERGR